MQLVAPCQCPILRPLKEVWELLLHRRTCAFLYLQISEFPDGPADMIKLILTVIVRVIRNIVSHIPKLSGWDFLTLRKVIALVFDVDVCSQNCLQSYYEPCVLLPTIYFLNLK